MPCSGAQQSLASLKLVNILTIGYAALDSVNKCHRIRPAPPMRVLVLFISATHKRKQPQMVRINVAAFRPTSCLVSLPMSLLQTCSTPQVGFASCRVTGCLQTDGWLPTAAQTGSAASPAATCTTCTGQMQLQHLPKLAGLPLKPRRKPDSCCCTHPERC